MANVLTGLAADIYVARDVVSREHTGFISSVMINGGGGSEQGAVGGVVRSSFAPAATSAARTPSMTIPEGTDQTIANKTLTLTDDESVQIPWTGEDVRHVNNGAGYETIYGAQIEQAMRTISNKIELTLSNAIYVAASRAYGTAATTPFGTQGDLTDASMTLEILKANGAPKFENQMVVNTVAGGKFLGLQGRFNVSGEAGVANIMQQGILMKTSGLDIRESSQVKNLTKGTGAAYTTSAAGFAVGATSIAIITGTGTVVAGDVVTFAGDTNKYVVATGVAGAGTIVLNAPGLLVAIPAAATAMTIGATSVRNAVFNRRAIELAVREPSMPPGGDAAAEAMSVVDERSGLVFSIRFYKGFRKAMIDVGTVWGAKVWIPEHTAALLG